MTEQVAKVAIDSLIRKSRVHLYKPIQIAEILYRCRVKGDIDLLNLEEYRNPSKRWRDAVCLRFVGKVSTSSAKYQDDVFNKHAIYPELLGLLGQINNEKNGIVEAYIYRRFAERMSQMSSAFEYCNENGVETFQLRDFLDLFWHEPGLKRSIDKIYEIVVYALFSALVDAIGIKVEVSMDQERVEILQEFSEFAFDVIRLSPDSQSFAVSAKIHRVGVTNAADRGLDMYANFGLAIQIKHLSLTEELAEGIVGSVSADKIVIVCKDGERSVILSLLNQIGWKSKIQSIITESKLLDWYERALRGRYADQIGHIVLTNITQELRSEFPTSDRADFVDFQNSRGYLDLIDQVWS